ncbi:helix-turn-helix transcriptional regulator [Rhizobium sp. TRM95796]|uniref:helix-turn-helix transcriptional regulator n=1 Tax=Rhizobium sp. TRM95796 TaxID=2979862 RepID=UPI0021E92C3D|nr:helix-turn-helix transcriptional regulator [Rhizobium sp. TRM95796]MCV3764377.1 helix-turn-helix transcriptional regulator [Rhizobium sp. TRM95796]
MRHLLAARPGIGATGHITQAGRLGYTSITNDLPLIIMVRRGHKLIQSSGTTIRIDEGEAVAIAAGQAIDFENVAAEDGDYEARWLVFDPSVVAGFPPPAAALPIAAPQRLGRMPPGLLKAYEQAVEALTDEDEVPDLVARHKLGELLAWLASAGWRFPPAVQESYTARIRRLVGARPHGVWSGAEICAHLAVSEATLRRRLSEEGTSLRAVLTDVRMTHAMQLLQCSRLPVSEIAARAGFESQSRFAIRFRHRFGFPPSAIRGHRRVQPG